MKCPYCGITEIPAKEDEIEVKVYCEYQGELALWLSFVFKDTKEMQAIPLYGFSKFVSQILKNGVLVDERTDTVDEGEELYIWLTEAHFMNHVTRRGLML